MLPIVGVLAPPSLLAACSEGWEGLLGTPVMESPVWDFTATDYYAAEMGPDLARRFLAFAPRVPDLVAWKEAAGAREARCSTPLGRRVNLDPGYVSLGALVLASTKPSGHRIHLARGIHAEVTLYFHRGHWTALPWTFPEFLQRRYDAFLEACRSRLKEASRP